MSMFFIPRRMPSEHEIHTQKIYIYIFKGNFCGEGEHLKKVLVNQLNAYMQKNKKDIGNS